MGLDVSKTKEITLNVVPNVVRSVFGRGFKTPFPLSFLVIK